MACGGKARGQAGSQCRVKDPAGGRLLGAQRVNPGSPAAPEMGRAGRERGWRTEWSGEKRDGEQRARGEGALGPAGMPCRPQSALGKQETRYRRSIAEAPPPLPGLANVLASTNAPVGAGGAGWREALSTRLAPVATLRVDTTKLRPPARLAGHRPDHLHLLAAARTEARRHLNLSPAAASTTSLRARTAASPTASTRFYRSSHTGPPFPLQYLFPRRGLHLLCRCLVPGRTPRQPPAEAGRIGWQRWRTELQSTGS